MPEPLDQDAQAAPVIDSRSGFHAAVAWCVRCADARQARELWWVDPDFAEWPLDDPALLEGLTAWLKRPARRLVLLAAGYETVERVHPRFTAWRVSWAHAVEARRLAAESTLELPTLVVDDGPVSMQLLDRLLWRGRAGQDARLASGCREGLDALLQHSEPGWPVRTLGL